MTTATITYGKAPLLPVTKVEGSAENIVEAIAPPTLSSSHTTSSYPIKGTDTITIGDQTRWGLVKKVLFSLFYPNFLLNSIEHPLESLRQAVDAGSQVSFRKTIAYNDFQKSPGLIKEAIDLALEVGWYILAVELAEMGSKMFPDVPLLQKYARILAPPKIVDSQVPPCAGISDTTAWLKKNSAEYRGLWVAIRYGNLVGSARKRAELEEIIQSLPSQDGIIVTKVPNITIKF